MKSLCSVLFYLEEETPSPFLPSAHLVSRFWNYSRGFPLPYKQRLQPNPSRKDDRKAKIRPLARRDTHFSLEGFLEGVRSRTALYCKGKSYLQATKAFCPDLKPLCDRDVLQLCALARVVCLHARQPPYSSQPLARTVCSTFQHSGIRGALAVPATLGARM